MTKSSGLLSLAFKALQKFFIPGVVPVQHFDCNPSADTELLGEIYLAHTPFPYLLNYPVAALDLLAD
jgi:hypothetical protein